MLTPNFPNGPFFMSAGISLGVGMSRMWPTEASTTHPAPRYPAIDLILLGDSTMTSLWPVAVGGAIATITSCPGHVQRIRRCSDVRDARHCRT